MKKEIPKKINEILNEFIDGVNKILANKVTKINSFHIIYKK